MNQTKPDAGKYCADQYGPHLYKVKHPNGDIICWALSYDRAQQIVSALNEATKATSRGLCDDCVGKLHLDEQCKDSNFGTLEGRCDFCGERRPTRDFNISGAQTI